MLKVDQIKQTKDKWETELNTLFEMLQYQKHKAHLKITTCQRMNIINIGYLHYYRPD